MKKTRRTFLRSGSFAFFQPSDDNGKIADELVSFGLTEGNSRVHQGQGTTNCTFSFENFFFEILWVHNEQEIRSNLINPTGLWNTSKLQDKQLFTFWPLCR